MRCEQLVTPQGDFLTTLEYDSGATEEDCAEDPDYDPDDCNGDGLIDLFDIDAFVEQVVGR